MDLSLRLLTYKRSNEKKEREEKFSRQLHPGRGELENILFYRHQNRRDGPKCRSQHHLPRPGRGKGKSRNQPPGQNSSGCREGKGDLVGNENKKGSRREVPVTVREKKRN